MYKKIMEPIKAWLFESNITTKQTLFRFMILCGEIFSVISIVANFFTIGYGKSIILDIIVVILISFSALLDLKYNQHKYAKYLMGCTIVYVLFPFTFFYCGGINGGSSVWLILGYYYIFTMFEGKGLKIFLYTNIILDILIYCASYQHPQLIINYSDRASIYFDSALAVILVGICGGVLIKVHIRALDKDIKIIEEKNNELREASKAQDTFYARMSHEISTPLNIVLGMDEMILRKSDDADIHTYAKNIYSSSRLLLGLLDDVLDYTQIEQNKMKLYEVDYRPDVMIQEVVDMIRNDMNRKNLKFSVEVDPTLPSKLMGDAKRIEQVVLNLLSNAIKYTQEGSILFSIDCKRSGAEKVELTISVQDTGIGIRKEDMSTLYNAFVCKKENESSGNGLGLAISKQLVELMGGTISVDSIYTKGSIFTVNIKQKVVDPTELGFRDYLSGRAFEEFDKKYEALFEAPEANILIVDDNKTNITVLQNLLEDVKVVIDSANSFEECIRKTSENYYHVILMDYMIPDTNGAEIFKYIRKQENGLCRNTPVILMTASSTSEVKRILDTSNFDGCIEKPVRTYELESELLKFIPDELIEYKRSEGLDKGVYSYALENSKNRKRKIVISTDCVADIPNELAERYDIKIIYMYIKTESGRFADNKEIDSDNISRYIENGKMTAHADSVSVEEYEQFFAELLIDAENVIHISMASRSGKSYGMAVEGAKGFDHVHVVDSAHISGGQGLVAISAAKLVLEGYELDEILEKIEIKKREYCTKFIMPSVEIFYDSGYTGKLTLNICKFLKARPVLSIKKSKLSVSTLVFGSFEQSFRVFIRILLFHKSRIDDDVIFVTYVNLNDEELTFIKEEIGKIVKFKNIIIQKASFSSACNSGDHSVGISVLKKD